MPFKVNGHGPSGVTVAISFGSSQLDGAVGNPDDDENAAVIIKADNDPRGTRMFYRVNDSAGGQARVQMYESMTDVDTGIGVSPSLAGGWYWVKSNNYPDSTARYVLAVTFEILGGEITIYEPLRAAIAELQAQTEADIEDSEVEVEVETNE